jgi:hypothetical protein
MEGMSTNFEQETQAVLKEISTTQEFKNESMKFFQGMEAHFKSCHERCGEDEACMKPCVAEFTSSIGS